jgi:hypothetical protein
MALGMGKAKTVTGVAAKVMAVKEASETGEAVMAAEKVAVAWARVVEALDWAAVVKAAVVKAAWVVMVEPLERATGVAVAAAEGERWVAAGASATAGLRGARQESEWSPHRRSPQSGTVDFQRAGAQ